MFSVFANILSFIGNCCFTGSSLFKNKKVIITFQSICHILNSISEFIQKAFSGIAQELVSLLRDFILLFIPDSKKNIKLIVSIICISLSILIGILLNVFISNNIWYGYLPVLGTFSYSIFLVLGCLKKNPLISEMLIKIGLIFNGIFWATYGIFVKLYPTTIFNTITIIISITSIIKIILIIRKNNSKNDEVNI